MPLSRTQTFRRRRIAVFGSLALVLSVGFYLPLTLLAPVGPATAHLVPYIAPELEEPQVELPSYGASGIGAVGFPGMLAESGSSEALPIASIAKVITSLVVLDEKSLELGEEGPLIAFNDADVAIRDALVAANGLVLPVRAGIELSQRDVIEIVLVGSANNYALSLANWAFGSEDEFVAAANRWLALQGLTDTVTVDSTGMSPMNVSTATDLVELGKLALAHPVVAEVVGLRQISVPHLGTLDNRNQLLGVEGVTGVKTGTLTAAGACLLFSAEVVVGTESVTVVGVVLGADDHVQARASVLALLASARPGFQQVALAKAGDVVAAYSTPWGSVADAVVAEDVSMVVWSNSAITALVELDPIVSAPAGSAAGSIVFAAGDRRVRVPLRLSGAIEDAEPWWRLTHPADLF